MTDSDNTNERRMSDYVYLYLSDYINKLQELFRLDQYFISLDPIVKFHDMSNGVRLVHDDDNYHGVEFEFTAAFFESPASVKTKSIIHAFALLFFNSLDLAVDKKKITGTLSPEYERIWFNQIFAAFQQSKNRFASMMLPMVEKTIGLINIQSYFDTDSSVGSDWKFPDRIYTDSNPDTVYLTKQEYLDADQKNSQILSDSFAHNSTQIAKLHELSRNIDDRVNKLERERRLELPLQVELTERLMTTLEPYRVELPHDAKYIHFIIYDGNGKWLPGVDFNYELTDTGISFTAGRTLVDGDRKIPPGKIMFIAFLSYGRFYFDDHFEFDGNHRLTEITVRVGGCGLRFIEKSKFVGRWTEADHYLIDNARNGQDVLPKDRNVRENNSDMAVTYDQVVS